MRLGIFDHFGWATAVTASSDHAVVDRRRIELVEHGVTPAPVHYDARHHDDATLVALIDDVRASIRRSTEVAFADLPVGIESISLRTWPPDFPTDVTVIRRSPWEARADAVMYRQVVAEVADALGWAVHLYEAKVVLGQAEAILGDRAVAVLDGPRAALGPPWTKDHRVALAATVVASSAPAAAPSD